MTIEMTTGKPSKERKALVAVLKSILCLTRSQESFSRSGLMRSCLLREKQLWLQDFEFSNNILTNNRFFTAQVLNFLAFGLHFFYLCL